ncbi:MAG: phosphotransferase [Candidatus Aureabacteria bacterium]|nr:phosphotransferase [Candidatus Auribacterota bacterium]
MSLTEKEFAAAAKKKFKRPVMKSIRLKGDASDRHYFRLWVTGRPETVIAMVNNSPFDHNLPFITINSFFLRNSVSVPEIIDVDYDSGIIYLSDCGDTSMEKLLSGSHPGGHIEPYKKCIDELVKIHSIRESPECPVIFANSFDFDKLMWELDFFLTHTVKNLLGVNIAKKDISSIQSLFSRICGILEREPRVVTHRDYHSRNIFFKEGRVFVLDFQDARMGPRQYDLCSLLKDSYFRLPEEDVDKLISYYLDKSGTEDADAGRFTRIFYLMAFQRNLKAAGTFGYLSTVKNKKEYERFLPGTFEYIWSYSKKYDELREPAEILRNYISY